MQPTLEMGLKLKQLKCDKDNIETGQKNLCIRVKKKLLPCLGEMIKNWWNEGEKKMSWK